MANIKEYPRNKEGSNISKIVGHEIAQSLVEKEVIVFRPMAYMRGDTFDDSLMVLDEAQNATFKQLMLFVTRMGKKSKVIITGDVSQVLTGLHQIKINIGSNLKKLEYLIQHLTVLSGYADPYFDTFCRSKGFTYRGHLDGFRAGSKNKQHTTIRHCISFEKPIRRGKCPV